MNNLAVRFTSRLWFRVLLFAILALGAFAAGFLTAPRP